VVLKSEISKKIEAMDKPKKKEEALTLSLQVLTPADVSRLNREVEDIEDFFSTAAVRGGTEAKSMPQVSQFLNNLLKDNSLNILHKADRTQLGEFLSGVMKSAPIVHASFATEPRPEFLMKLIAWFRREAHPYVLFKIGLQPTIAAGCVIRTTNKYFDFSFKRHFADSKAKLGDALRSDK